MIDENNHVTLIDFGICSIFKEGELCTDYSGTSCYVAPEIIARKPYDARASDVFALGVILYCLLFGLFPFDNLEIGAKVGDLELVFAENSKVSGGARSLLTSMLRKNPKKRITVEKIMEHPWIKGINFIIPSN